jgi:hypothetical protein
VYGGSKCRQREPPVEKLAAIAYFGIIYEHI